MRDPITVPEHDLTNHATKRSREGHAGSRTSEALTTPSLEGVKALRDPLTSDASLSQKPWWTEADRAEFDVLIDALVGAVLDHRQRCTICAAGGPWCAALRDGLCIVIEWRNTRIRRSKAAWLAFLEEDQT
jgi:hypothetical protein